MRRALAVIALVALWLHVGLSDSAQADETCAGVAPSLPGCIQVVSWTRITDDAVLTVYSLPQVAMYIDAAGAVWSGAFTPFCSTNVSGTLILRDDLCNGARKTCAIYGSGAKLAMYMVITSLSTADDPRLLGPLCFSESAVINVGPEIREAVEQVIGFAAPPIVLQPERAIVNLPMIVHTDARKPIVIDIDGPIAGVAEATPEYLWAFADGAAAHGPGLPYDGTSPTMNPGYYVAYTYHALGTPTIGLTVTWRVTFTVPGNPPVPLDDVLRQETATTTVRAAGSELVGG